MFDRLPCAGIADAGIASAVAEKPDQIELIASENIVLPGVLAAQVWVLTNQYAEDGAD